MTTEAQRGPGRSRSATKLAGPPTIRQVAAVAGVSRATASRVISGSGLVSDASRAAVEKAIEELGFVPNPTARNLARGRTGSVALVVPEPNSRVLSDPFFAEIIVGLSDQLDDQDLQVILLIARTGSRTEKIVRYLTGGHVDGAVIASHHRDDTLNRRVGTGALPCVFVGRPLGVPQAHYVDVDNFRGGQLAAQHLIQTGHRRIATIAGPTDMTAGIDRLAGWRDAMSRAGLPTDAVAHGEFTQLSGAQAMERLLHLHPDLDAVFAASDLMAAGALTRLAAAGKSVPGDVAVIGFDDIAVGESTNPPLTTIAQPVRAMAARAGAQLLRLIARDELDADPVLFPPEIVVRESA
jgi:DNA-binding LacI/PurR family transcriptional regulator